MLGSLEAHSQNTYTLMNQDIPVNHMNTNSLFITYIYTTLQRVEKKEIKLCPLNWNTQNNKIQSFLSRIYQEISRKRVNNQTASRFKPITHIDINQDSTQEGS